MKRNPTFQSSDLLAFIALCCDGEPIAGQAHEQCSHNAALLANDARRKAKFLRLGTVVLREFARRLGCENPHEAVHANPSGVITSGDVYLDGGGFRVTFTHHTPRMPYGDIHYSHAGDRTVRGWLRWEELEDLDGCVRRIQVGNEPITQENEVQVDDEPITQEDEALGNTTDTSRVPDEEEVPS